MAKEPFLPLFYGDFLASTGEWAGEERSLYLSLLAQQWVSPQRSLPADTEKLRTLVGWSDTHFDRYWPTVSTKFSTRDDGRLANLRLEAHRQKTVEISRQNSVAGRLGVEAKKKRALGKEKATASADGVKNHSATKANADANGSERSSGRLNFAQAPSHPIPSHPQKQESASGSETEVGSEKPPNPDEERALLKKPVESESEIRRKALAALQGGLDAPTVAKAFKVRVAQVREWQREVA